MSSTDAATAPHAESIGITPGSGRRRSGAKVTVQDPVPADAATGSGPTEDGAPLAGAHHGTNVSRYRRTSRASPTMSSSDMEYPMKSRWPVMRATAARQRRDRPHGRSAGSRRDDDGFPGGRRHRESSSTTANPDAAVRESIIESDQGRCCSWVRSRSVLAVGWW